MNGQAAGREWTVSIAVPGSVIDNTQNAEFANFVAGQIARAAAIFNIDEVVVIDEEPTGDGTVSAGAAFLANILQYQETPQYLRKALVPFHRDLRLAGLLPPVDAPHHMRAMEWKPFREGVVTSSDATTGSLVDVGLYEMQAHVPQALRMGARVTLAMGDRPEPEAHPSGGEGEVLPARLVPPSEPRTAGGLYWGYTTRLASGLSEALTDSPFEGGYDLIVGTSERGSAAEAPQLALPPFKHALIAFGGPKGLEDCAAKDPSLKGRPTAGLFTTYVNTAPGQGSRTIRTEEAVLVSLGFMQSAIRAAARQ